MPKGRRVVDQNVADLVTYTLQDVIAYGTGASARLSSWPAAGKTGTAQDNVDAWFCGYTVQIAACVWVGFPKGQDPAREHRRRATGLRRDDPGRDLERLHGDRHGGQEGDLLPGAVVREANRDAVGGGAAPAAAVAEPLAKTLAQRGTDPVPLADPVPLGDPDAFGDADAFDRPAGHPAGR